MPNRPRPRYREIVVAGSHREMGRQLGEAARDEIRGFVEIAIPQVQKTTRVDATRALQVARACVAPVQRYSPDLWEEIEGTAEGAGVSSDQILLLQVRNQLGAAADSGCTSVSLAPSAATVGRALVGQNWDNDPALDPFTVVLTRRPIGKPALTNITQAGLIAYIGFNDAGIGACLNTLPAPSRAVGVPHYFTLRRIYEATSLEAAADSVRRADRAIPANIMLATPQGPADLEVTLDAVRILFDPQRLVHANHCLHPDLAPINADFPPLIQSDTRQQRMSHLISSRRAHSLDDLKQALSDHEDYPYSICRHANSDPAHGFWETTISVLIDPQAREMHVARGTPCTTPYETYRMPPKN